MNSKVLLAVAIIVVVSGLQPAQAEPISVQSKVETVTVYRGQALVTRQVALPQESGELELLVSDLPAQIVGASLHTSAADGVTIRSVRYRTRAVGDEPKKEVAELDKQIKALNRELQANSEMWRLVEAKSQFIGKLEGFTSATAKADAGMGVLDPAATDKMTSQIFDRLTELSKARTERIEEDENLKQEIDLLQRKRNELTGGSSRTVREAVVFVTKAAKADGSIRLSYLVGSSTWTPAYNIRTGQDDRTIAVEYLAQVQQMSGEDWTGVKLTLSTATPAMNAQSPLLVPLWIDLRGARAGEEGGWSYEKLSRIQQEGAADQYGNLGRWQNPASRDERLGANWELNRLAGEGQTLEFNAPEENARAGAMARRSVEEGLAVSYGLDGPMSLASRADSQLVQIARIDLQADSYCVAIPLLSSYVYRVAKLSNTSSLPLLAGQYSAYVQGEFVGRGELSLVARGQEFTLGLGVDTQLRCHRELMEKSDEIVWGSRVQKFNYRLRIENYKDKAVAVRLLDRIPATKSEDVKITLGKVSDKLSTDEVYLRDFKDRGILRWDLEVAANAAGAKARDVTYGFEMKYAKDVHVGKLAASATETMKAEYNKMLLKQ